jgi:hypothetical protein
LQRGVELTITEARGHRNHCEVVARAAAAPRLHALQLCQYLAGQMRVEPHEVDRAPMQ